MASTGKQSNKYTGTATFSTGVKGEKVLQRKKVRGRPPGKRTPLTAEERKQRNAQTERERRDEVAEAFAMLQHTIGQGSTRSDILRSATDYITSRSNVQETSVAELQKQNRCLEYQIGVLQERLGIKLDPDDEV